MPRNEKLAGKPKKDAEKSLKKVRKSAKVNEPKAAKPPKNAPPVEEPLELEDVAAAEVPQEGEVSLTAEEIKEINNLTVRKLIGEATLFELDCDLRRQEIVMATAEAQVKQRQAAEFAAQDSENRECRFFGGFDWDTVNEAFTQLNELDRRFPGEPIRIVLCSPGGDPDVGLALFDLIREMSRRGHKMTVVVRGIAASMGGIFLQAGDVRVIGPESRFHIHEIAAGTEGKLAEMEEDVAHFRAVWEHCAGILARKSKMSAKEILAKARNREWWLSAQQAVKLGFADEIG
jgi:ATP-dependent protease ClpP protease subunit